MKVTELRALVLDNAEEFITLYFDFLHDRNQARLKLQGIEKHAAEVFQRLIPVLDQADDLVSTEVKGSTSPERVANILEQVAAGELSARQGEQLLKLEQAGFDITELPALLERLADLEGKPQI